MTTPFEVDSVRQFQETQVAQGLRLAAHDLHEVAKDFFSMGEDMLADEANILCGKVADLLYVLE